MFDVIGEWFIGRGLTPQSVKAINAGLSVVFLVILALAASFVARHALAPLIEKTVKRTNVVWDDLLARHNFFTRLAHLLPVLVLSIGADFVFASDNYLAEIIRRFIATLFVFVGVWTLDAFLGGVHDIYNTYEISRNKPIRGYIQAVKIIVYLCGGIFVVALLMNKSPWGILSVFGGLTAVLILIFKDTILGFVAGIQLSANDMVRVGDWIEMPKYGADGDVIDVSINTVKVRNWDKTITTIPTYALVSDTFINWRGMSESGGRRIKRSIYLDMHTIKFCDAHMRERFGKIALLKEYLDKKEAEINAYNLEHNVDPSMVLNGRRQTNIGVFRAYVVAYLRNHPQIHQDMTFLVRHLEPTPQGLPLQIYVFSKDQVWANYEAIQADIFDHVLAAVPEFDLRVFQYPSGFDLR
jgi:miniconductance mechanosensitive channel